MNTAQSAYPFEPGPDALGWGDCTQENNSPALRWERISKHCWRSLGDTNYTIAAFKVGQVILYRPSNAGQFISGACSTADEAKQICINHFIATR